LNDDPNVSSVRLFGSKVFTLQMVRLLDVLVVTLGLISAESILITRSPGIQIHLSPGFMVGLLTSSKLFTPGPPHGLVLHLLLSLEMEHIEAWPTQIISFVDLMQCKLMTNRHLGSL
jgi:hypothetical protein